MTRSLGARMRPILGLMLLVLAPLVGTGIAEAQERLEGIIERPSGGTSGRWPFTIRIETYTSDEEADESLRVLREQGARAMQDRLVDLDRARFQITGQRSVNIGEVRSIPTGDGGRILRFMAGGELEISGAGVGRDSEPMFSIIELQLDEQGEGAGAVYAAATIELDGDDGLVIENLTPPYQVTTVKVR